LKLRSLLYVPADNSRFIAKAHLRGADAIILDLEDAVLPEHKTAARENLGQSVAHVGQSGAQVFVRINSETDAAKQDAGAALIAGARAIYVSKASPNSLSVLDGFLGGLEAELTRDPIGFVPLIESAASLLVVGKISRHKRAIALSVGGEDLANDLGGQPDPDVLKLPKQMVHFAARSSGLMSFGTFRSVANYTDLDAIRAAALQAKRFGFDGASCVHPGVVPVLNAAFQPSGEEIDWATEVLSRAANSRAGSFSVDGKMIDAPVLERARRILAQE